MLWYDFNVLSLPDGWFNRYLFLSYISHLHYRNSIYQNMKRSDVLDPYKNGQPVSIQ